LSKYGKLLDLNDKLRDKQIEEKGQIVFDFFNKYDFLLPGFNLVNDARDYSFYGFIPDIVKECETFSDKENIPLFMDSFVYGLIYKNLLGALKLFIDMNVECILRNCELNKDNIDEYIKILEKNITKEKIEENKVLLEQVKHLKNIMIIYDDLLNNIS